MQRGVAAADKPIVDALSVLRKELEFLKGCRREDGEIVFIPECIPPATEVLKLNSPTNYDPQRFQTEIGKLGDLLRGKNP